MRWRIQQQACHLASQHDNNWYRWVITAFQRCSRHYQLITAQCQGAPRRLGIEHNRFLRKGASMFEGLFQPMHLLVIFGIALIVFGPKKLPELGKGIGEGIRGFKSAMKAEDEKLAVVRVTADEDRTRPLA
jgi:sec-independent protein translocase protein TatA